MASWTSLRPTLAAVLVALAVFAGTDRQPAAAATDPMGAQEFVDTFIQRGLEALQAEDSAAQKLATGKQLMADNFDLPAISRFVLGRYGRRVEKEKLEEYQLVYFNYVTHTYLAKLAGTTENSYAVKVVGSEAFNQGDALVKSEVTQPKGGDTLEMGWRVRSYGDSYRIVDMLIAGVSLAVTQRSEFGSILKKDGLDGLIMAMREKSAEAGGDPNAPLPDAATIVNLQQPAAETPPAADEADAEAAANAGEANAKAGEANAKAEEEARAAKQAKLRQDREAERKQREENRSEARSLLEETQKLLDALDQPAAE